MPLVMQEILVDGQIKARGYTMSHRYRSCFVKDLQILTQSLSHAINDLLRSKLTHAFDS